MALTLIVPALSAAATVVNFDDPAINVEKDPITDQFHALGVDFARQPAVYVQQVPAGEAQSGSRVLDISHARGDAPSDVAGTFVQAQSSVGISIGLFDAPGGGVAPGATATLTIYDATGNQLDATSQLLANPPIGFHTVMVLTRPQGDIASFSVVTAPFGSAGIDDLTFAQNHTVSVQVTGPGGVTAPGGISCPASCAGTFASGSSAVLTATASPGSVFAGWTGACASFGTQPSCTLAIADSDLAAGASFRSPNLTVALSGSGGGVVQSTPAGIVCGGTCSAAFPGGTAVTLTASPAGGWVFTGWSGACALSGLSSTCSLALHGDTTVGATFQSAQHATFPQAAAPLIDGGQTSQLPALLPPPVKSLSVDVTGDGSVSNGAPRARTQQALTAQGIECGSSLFVCFAVATPGALWKLHATPAKGQVFKHWTGACTGTRPICISSLAGNAIVGAVFAPRRAVRTVAAALDRPAFHVRWKQSIGGGTLVVTGQVAKSALVRLQLRRPLGAPLLTELLTVGAGRFTRVVRLSPGTFSHGARLFPGGFIVVLTGSSSGHPLVRQLQTIVLPAPGRGVVRHAFASTTVNGKALKTVRAGGGRVWANFVLQTQPRKGEPITVSWYWPDGRLLGRIPKPNRPTVTSWLGSGLVSLPPGDWRAELRVGGTVVSALRVALR